MTREVVAFHVMRSLAVCRVKLRASGRAMWEGLVPDQERCAGCGGKWSKWGGPAFTWWAPLALRTGGESKIQAYAVLLYLIS